MLPSKKETLAKPKIIHIITGLNDGGAEGVLYRLCTANREWDHQVISLMGLGKYGIKLQEEGVTVTALDFPRGRANPSGLIHIWKILRREAPDAVQTWMYHADLIGGVIAKVSGIKKIFWGIRHSNLDPKSSKKTTIAISAICAKLSGLIPTRIICCAENAALIHSNIGYKKEKLVVINNGYNLTTFKPSPNHRDELRNTLQIKGLIIGMVARFDAQKDHSNLINALAILISQKPDFTCLLIGSNVTPNNKELKELVEKNNLQNHVKLLGSRNDIHKVMNALDIHILSSSHGEAFPNVLAEAMACGTPCVATDVGDSKAILGNTGWIVEPRDSRALSNAIRNAIEEFEERPSKWSERKISTRNRVLEKFSLEGMVDKYNLTWGRELD